MKEGTVQRKLEESDIGANKTGKKNKKQLTLWTELKWLQTDANAACLKPWR